MLVETDDLGGWPIPRTVIARAFNGVGDRLEERVRRHGAGEPERRVKGDKLSVPVFKGEWSFGRQHCFGNCAERHTLTAPQVGTIRQPTIGYTFVNTGKGLTHGIGKPFICCDNPSIIVAPERDAA